MQRLLEHLSSEEKEEIRQKAIAKISSYTCPICLENVKIPVRLKTPHVHCSDCGDSRTAIGCLRCVRTWLELNKPSCERQVRYHLICKKPIDTKRLKSSNSYTIDMNLLHDLDQYCSRVVTCECGSEFNKRIDMYTHMKDGTCPESYLPCPIKGCSFYGKTPDIMKHLYSNSCQKLDYINNWATTDLFYNP